MVSKRLHAAVAAALSAGALFLTLPATARNVSIDTRTGEYWTDTRVNLTSNGLVTGSLPFALNLGDGAKLYDFSFSENGFVQFIAPGGTGSSLLPPGGNYIAPFAADLAVGTNGRVASTLYGSGTFDPTPPYSGRPEDATQKEFRFQWLGMCPAGNLACSSPDYFEFVLTDGGAGDFLLEFNYGFRSSSVSGDPTSALGQQGFSLGSNVLGLHAGPFTSADAFYCFVGGVGTRCDGVLPAIPEPETYALLAFGLVTIGVVTRRRRSKARMSGNIHVMVGAALAAGTLLLPATATARNVSVDFIPFELSGEDWAGGFVDVANNGSFRGTLPFQLNFGDGPKLYDFVLSENGFVRFVLPGVAATGALPPSGNYIAAFAADLVLGNFFGISGISYARGLIDPVAPYNLSEATVSGFRFTWVGMCPASQPDCASPDSFQIVLRDRGAGNFLLQYNYGFAANSQTVYGDPTSMVGQQGYALGDNVLALHSGPFNSRNADYCFIGGVGGLCNVAAIPEPETYAMLAIGFGVVGGMTRRRRVAKV